MSGWAQPKHHKRPWVVFGLALVSVGAVFASTGFVRADDAAKKQPQVLLDKVGTQEAADKQAQDLLQKIATDDAAAKKAIETAVQIFRDQGASDLVDLETGLKQITLGKTDNAANIEHANVAFAGMKRFKENLESVAAIVTPNTKDVFASVVLSFYSLRDSLYSAAEIYKGKVSFTQTSVLDLDLILSPETSWEILERDSEASAKMKLERFELKFALTDQPNGKKRLSIQGEDLRALGITTAIYFPSEAMVKRILDIEALKMNFLEHATLGALLYKNEKSDVIMPYKAELVIKSMHNEAEAITRESLMRRGMTESQFKKVSDAIAKQRVSDFALLHFDSKGNVDLNLKQNPYDPDCKIEEPGCLVNDVQQTVPYITFEQIRNTLGKDRIDPKRIEKYSNPLTIKIDGGKELKLDITLENIALSYLNFEKKGRVQSLQEAFKSTPEKFTEIGAEQTKRQVYRILLQAEKTLIWSMIDQAFFDVKKLDDPKFLTVAERQNLTLMVHTLADLALSIDVETDDPVRKTFIDILQEAKFQPEVSVSVARYQFAEKLLEAVEVTELVDQKIKKLHGSPIAADSEIPASPNPGFVMLAMNPREDLPTWLKEVFEYLGGALSNPKIQSSIKKIALLQSAVKQTPGFIFKTVKEINELVGLEYSEIAPHLNRLPECPSDIPNCAPSLTRIAANTVLMEMVNLDKKLTNETPGYAWLSWDGKAKALLNEVKNENTKEVLKKFILLKWAASDALKSNSLAALIKKGFEDLLQRDDDGLNELREEARKSQVFVVENDSFLGSVFTEANMRNDFLRKMLKDAEVFKRYFSFYSAERLNSLPILSAPIFQPPYEEEMDEYEQKFKRGDLGSDKGKAYLSNRRVTLLELIRSLKRSLRALGPDGPERNLGKLLSGMNYRFLFDEGYLNTIVDSSVPLQGILENAFRDVQYIKEATPVQSNPLLAKLGGSFVCWIYGGGDNCSEIDPAANSRYEYWPKFLKARDIMPALTDKESSDYSRLLKIIVSSVASTYLRSMQEGNENFSKIILDPESDESKKLLKSHAYDKLLTDMSPLAGGLEQYRGRVLKWQKATESFKKLTTFTQEINNQLFFATLAHPEGQATLHTLCLAFMVSSTALDLSADFMLYLDKWQTYSELKSMANTGGLSNDGALVNYSDLESARQELIERSSHLVHRIPMDFMFMFGFGHGTYQGMKQNRLFKSWGVKDYSAFVNDLVMMKAKVANAGLSLNAHNYVNIDSIVAGKLNVRPDGWSIDAAQKSKYGKASPLRVAADAISAFKRKYPGFVESLRQFGREGIADPAPVSAEASTTSSSSPGSSSTSSEPAQPKLLPAKGTPTEPVKPVDPSVKPKETPKPKEAPKAQPKPVEPPKTQTPPKAKPGNKQSVPKGPAIEVIPVETAGKAGESGKGPDSGGPEVPVDTSPRSPEIPIEVKSAYEVFGLTPDASLSVVKKQYKAKKAEVAKKLKELQPPKLKKARSDLNDLQHARNDKSNRARWKAEYKKFYGKEPASDAELNKFLDLQEQGLKQYVDLMSPDISRLEMQSKRLDRALARIEVAQPKTKNQKNKAAELFDGYQVSASAGSPADLKNKAEAAMKELGIEPGTPIEKIKKQKQIFMAKNHPDAYVNKYVAENPKEPTKQELDKNTEAFVEKFTKENGKAPEQRHIDNNTNEFVRKFKSPTEKEIEDNNVKFKARKALFDDVIHYYEGGATKQDGPVNQGPGEADPAAPKPKSGFVMNCEKIGVDENVSVADVTKLKKQYIAKNHPDKFSAAYAETHGGEKPGAEATKAHSDAFSDMVKAYDYVIDVQKIRESSRDSNKK